MTLSDIQSFVWQIAQDAVQVMRGDRRYWMSVPFYAYYTPADGRTPGKVQIFADMDVVPAGYTLIWVERVGYGETMHDTVTWLVKALRKLPILPID